MSTPTWKANLRNPHAWKKTLTETIMWVLFACIVIKMLELFAPGYPFMVNTPSVKEGIYWRDRTALNLQRGDITSFAFEPTQAVLRERYWTPGRVHTKRIVGLAGDSVSVDAKGNITVCVRKRETVECSPHGALLATDKQGRALVGWVAPGKSYTIAQGEAWLMGEHPKSLDSRYQGPLPVAALWGKAHLLLGWGD